MLEVVAAKTDFAGGGLDEFQDGAAGGGFAAAGFADEAEGVALINLEANAVDSLHGIGRAAPQAFVHGEMDGEVAHLEQGFLVFADHFFFRRGLY